MADTTPEPDAEAPPEERTVQFKIDPATLARLDAACERFGIQRAHVLNRAAMSAADYLEQMADPFAGMTFGGTKPHATGGFNPGPGVRSASQAAEDAES